MRPLFALIISGILVFLPSASLKADTSSVLRPVADGSEDGAGWTNTAGTACNSADCSMEVRESSGSSCANSDGNASFISSATNGVNQTFDLDESSIPNGATVTQIAVTTCYQWQGGGPTAPTFRTRVCVDGACSNFGADLTGVASYRESTQSHTVNFKKTSASRIEIGASRTNEKNLRISQISAIATYTLETPPPPPTPTSPSGGGGNVSPRVVVFSGQAYPLSTIEVLRKSVQDELYQQLPVETKTILEDGSFNISYTGVLGGDYLFALRVQDKDGRNTGVLAFNVPLQGDLFEAKGILVPPTIGFDKSIIAKDDILKIAGCAAPSNIVELEVDGLKHKEIKADQSGSWNFDMDAAYLAYGEHQIRARQTDTKGKASNFSIMRAFKLLQLLVSRADLNGDGAVNISDWSIFLFRWGSDKEELRLQNDINGDGKINIFDFSIFLQTMKL